MENVYQQNGYEDRIDYLKNLARNYGIDENVVLVTADLLGPSEDFDGLVTTLEDYENGYQF